MRTHAGHAPVCQKALRGSVRIPHDPQLHHRRSHEIDQLEGECQDGFPHGQHVRLGTVTESDDLSRCGGHRDPEIRGSRGGEHRFGGDGHAQADPAEHRGGVCLQRERQ